MKGSHWFVVGILVFLGIMFAIECRLPKKFVWTPTFSHYDNQPFGCAVFDSLLSGSFPRGYTVSRNTFYQLEQEDSINRRSILVIANELPLSKVDLTSMLKLAERGNKIMLVSNHFSSLLKDTLGFSNNYSRFSPALLKKYASSLLGRDSLYWVGDSAIYPRRTFYFNPYLCSTYFFADTIDVSILAEKQAPREEFAYVSDKDSVTVGDSILHFPVAMSLPWGKGELVLATNALLFTNYGMLDGGNATYLFRVLSRLKDFPVVRTEAYMQETAQEQMSPFRYFLAQKPLRWALYLSMMGILLFMVFTARRKQRAIPVMREPENKSLEFIELIGTLYYQKKDHADLVRKKYIFFAEELRREIQVDVEDVAEDERSFGRIARKTGMEAEDIRKLIREIRPVIYGGVDVSEERMKYYIDKMNEIINHL